MAPKSSKIENISNTSPVVAPKIEGFVGDNLQLSQQVWEGKWVILYFYPKDMTSGCTTEAQDFQNLKQEFEKQGAIIIGVSKDSVSSHVKFTEKEKLSFILLSDPDGKLCEKYGVWKEKSMYGRKYMGIERSTFLINPQGQIEREWRGLKVTGHAAEVLGELKRKI